MTAFVISLALIWVISIAVIVWANHAISDDRSDYQ